MRHYQISNNHVYVQEEASAYVNESFGLPGVVKCCRGRDCGHGAVYLDTWPPVTRIYDIYR